MRLLSQKAAGDVAAELYQLVAFCRLSTDDKRAPQGEGAAPFVCLLEQTAAVFLL